MSPLDGIRGLLIDVDGTLLVHDRAVPGAAEALGRLRRLGLAIRLTTNTTRRPRSEVAETLRREGIEVSTDDILAPSRLARLRIERSGRTRAALLVPDGALRDFEGLTKDELRPDWVVVGDLGADFTWDRLNTAFRALRKGAGFLALHKNRYWLPGPGEPVLDAGAFVAGLEYATGLRAEVIGKPSVAFFELALAELGLPPREVLVVGDDPDSDGAGGSAAGCRVLMVRTGKFAGDGPDAGGSFLVLDTIAELA